MLTILPSTATNGAPISRCFRYNNMSTEVVPIDLKNSNNMEQLNS